MPASASKAWKDERDDCTLVLKIIKREGGGRRVAANSCVPGLSVLYRLKAELSAAPDDLPLLENRGGHRA